MIQISAVIIAFNEERNIARCLESVKAVADEIVVVDSFSTDKTEQICGEHGVRFIKNKFEGHIEQKNFAVAQAKFDYVLSLDADEALSEELKSSIFEVKKNFLVTGYSMNRLTNYCGHWVRYCGWYPDTKLRLFDRRKGKWGGTNPHDKYILNDGAAIKLKGDLLHFTCNTITEHITQINKFSDIAAKALFEKKIKSGKIKMCIKAATRFIKIYFLKAGFLDGFYGWVIAVNSAHAVFLKYSKLYLFQIEKQKTVK